MIQTTHPIPIVPLRGGAVYPGITTTITVGRRRSLAAARAALQEDGYILIGIQYNSELEEPTQHDLVPIVVLAHVRDVIQTPQIGVQILVELQKRVRLVQLVEDDPYLAGIYETISEETDVASPELMANSIAYVEKYAELLGEVNQQVMNALRGKPTCGQLADYITGLLNLSFEMQLELLTDTNGVSRLRKVRDHLKQEIRIAEVKNKIQQEARQSTDKAQREYILREQMKSIRKELGEEEENSGDELRQKIENAGMPEIVHKRAKEELKRLERQGPQSAEASVIRTYLEWLIEIPWNSLTEDNLDPQHVREVLNEDHYGLEDVKDRIVEYVAVRKLAGANMKGAIINLNGPPGVGKTSIATSVARAMGRKVIRISLGGVRDEAEIRGHRRTYIGSLPGRLIRALRDAKTRNPIIVLDEVDKIGTDWRGDPSSALLEVLDPEQNHTFMDHYIEVPVDLSQVIFITTSNTTSTIPAPLFDRMESISMPGYVEDEKLCIAHNYLIRKQKKANGIEDIELQFTEDGLRKVIRHYTYEAGVRQLERNLGSIARKLAVKVANGQMGPFTVTEADVVTFLGPEKFSYGKAEEQDEIGVVTGLAVSGYGGDVMSIEVSLMEGTGHITLTGSLGDVMRESAQAALTYARAHARELGLEPAVFDKLNIHIHVPAGATPKDGPSAGIALATAIISALTRRPVRKDVAMTGEVTLRGKVLPIGGLKAKTIAAHRAGIKTVILPKENVKDIPELPERVRANLELIPVSQLAEVLGMVLLEPVGTPLTAGGDAGTEPNKLKIVPLVAGETSEGVRA